MQFEHLALNVLDPLAMAGWYVDHLGARVLTQDGAPKFTTFLADAGGRVFLELYRNDAAPVDDFARRHPLTFHVAVATADAATLRDRLVRAGASVHEEKAPEAGTLLVMLRDPFGVPLQLCQRTRPYPTGGQ